MAPRVKPPAEGETTEPGNGSNVPDGTGLMTWIQRVENLDQEKESEKGESKARLKVIAEDRKQAIEDAEKAGHSKATLKAHLKRRVLLRKAESLRDDLKGSLQDKYDAEVLALEKLGPLGEAALKAA